MSEQISIRPMVDADEDAVLAIYRIGIDEGNATFETSPPDWAHFRASKINNYSLVAADESGRAIGWVAAGLVSSRDCYAGVIEHSVYVDPGSRGRGVGLLLIQALVVASEANGVWTIQSSIFPENEASAALHQAAGFRVVGTRERIAQHHGRWRDSILIERRSTSRDEVRAAAPSSVGP